MKAGRSLAIVFGAGSILLITLVPIALRTLGSSGDDARKRAFHQLPRSGVAFSVSEMTSDDRIVIDEIIQWDVGGSEGYTFVILGGSEKKFVVIERGVRRERGWGEVAAEFGPAEAHVLSTAQEKGLDLFFDYLRRAPYFRQRDEDTYEITYFHRWQKVGSERWIDAYRLSSSFDGANDVSSDIRDLFIPEDWRRFTSPRMLDEIFARRANQPPEPTAMSVTPPAAQEPRQP